MFDLYGVRLIFIGDGDGIIIYNYVGLILRDIGYWYINVKWFCIDSGSFNLLEVFFLVGIV